MTLLRTFSLILIYCLITSQVIFAQSAGYLEDEGTSLWEDEGFIDSLGDEGEFDSGSGQYVGEDEAAARAEAARRAGEPNVDLAGALERDAELLPDNIIYGIGTGVTIGGWFALWTGQTARDNVRYISVGIIAGVLLGVFIGTKSVYQASNAPLTAPPENDPFENNRPLESEKPVLAQFNFGFNF